jgi:hypothetical protein
LLHPGFLSLGDWISCGNLDAWFGFLPDEMYQAEIRRAGIHLCTSETEGFGHYINESRAAGAVPVVLDGAPMNELVDDASGILIPVVNSVPQCCGLRYVTTPKLIEAALDGLFARSTEELAQLGQNARRRFEVESMACVDRMRAALADECFP